MSRVQSWRGVVMAAPLTVILALGHLTAGTTFGAIDAAAPPQRVSAAPAPCTVTIEPTRRTIDGTRLTDILPGAVICLPAGTRGNVKIANVHGTEEAPITIRNEGGPVVITGTDLEAGVYLQASSHVRITGSGVSSQCGALFESEEQECGIVIDGARKGVKVATSRGDANGLEIDHVEIRRVAADRETRGIAIHPIDAQTVADIHVHHNHIANTLAEGIYIGSELRKKSWEDLGKVDRLEVAYNLIENIGWDGIKVKVAVSESRIHHNVIRNVGQADYEAHRAGITLAMSQMIVDHNVILNAAEGIRTGRPREDVDNRYHDNLIVDVSLVAIQTTEARARIYNNTVVRIHGAAVRARGADSVVADNIIADATLALDLRKRSLDRRNLVESLDAIGFVDPTSGDFRLRDGSPAAGAGRIVDPTYCQAGMKATSPVRAAPGRTSPSERCYGDLGAEIAPEVVSRFPPGYLPTHFPSGPTAAPAGAL